MAKSRNCGNLPIRWCFNSDEPASAPLLDRNGEEPPASESKGFLRRLFGSAAPPGAPPAPASSQAPPTPPLAGRPEPAQLAAPPLGAPDSETMAAPLSTGPHGLPSAVAEGPEAAPSGGPCEVRGAAAAEAPEDDFASVASIEELHGSMYSDGYTSDGYASDGYYSDGEAPSARSSRGPKRASEAKTSETKDSEK